MKKTVVFFGVWCLMCIFVSAQGTLQFNQVKLIGPIAESVPANKVWKVVSYWQNYSPTTSSVNSTTCSSESGVSPIKINANFYHVERNGYTGYSANNTFPIWLPSGTTISTVCTKDILSVVEFNIVP